MSGGTLRAAARGVTVAKVAKTNIRRLAIVWIVLFLVGLAITIAGLLWRPTPLRQVRAGTPVEQSSRGNLRAALRFASVVPWGAMVIALPRASTRQRGPRCQGRRPQARPGGTGSC